MRRRQNEAGRNEMSKRRLYKFKLLRTTSSVVDGAAERRNEVPRAEIERCQEPASVAGASCVLCPAVGGWHAAVDGVCSVRADVAV